VVKVLLQRIVLGLVIFTLLITVLFLLGLVT
jgi:hypothetical protein